MNERDFTVDEVDDALRDLRRYVKQVRAASSDTWMGRAKTLATFCDDNRVVRQVMGDTRGAQDFVSEWLTARISASGPQWGSAPIDLPPLVPDRVRLLYGLFTLLRDGIPSAELMITIAGVRHENYDARARHLSDTLVVPFSDDIESLLTVLRRDVARAVIAAKTQLPSAVADVRSERREGEVGSCPFDVALSFAGEDRAFVERVHDELQVRGIRAFYDQDAHAVAELWGQDLAIELTSIYHSRAKYAMIFVSSHYARKVWTRQEFRAALARDITERSVYILPIRFDATELPGLLPTTRYLDARLDTPADIAAIFERKLRGPNGAGR